jgi:hypothetical protein
MVLGLRDNVEDIGFRVWGLGYRLVVAMNFAVYGSGYRV